MKVNAIMKLKKWKNVVAKNKLLTPVKLKCKGGDPCGTKPGQGGVADGGVVGEGVFAPKTTYTFEDICYYLKKGYRLELKFNPETKKIITKLVSGDVVLTTIGPKIRTQLLEKLPLRAVKREKFYTLYAMDYTQVRESTETAAWDMPFVKQIIGKNIWDRHEENEEDKKDPVDPSQEKLADDIVNKLLQLISKPQVNQDDVEQEVDQIVDQIVDEQGDITPEDPNRAGLIRFVKGAHLVYKRQGEDGSYEELWIYPIDKINSGHKIKRAILAGTDIELDTEHSPDGKQTNQVWTVGNAQMIQINGLPN